MSNTAGRRPFGTLSSGHPAELYSLANEGIRAKFTNFGATLVALEVPDRKGRFADVVLGFDSLAEYESPSNPYFGATIGRCANRIGGARFELDGETYALAANEGRNHLHGGTSGFDRAVWTGAIVSQGRHPGVRFRYASRDGEQGYPANLKAVVTYTIQLDERARRSALAIDMFAKCDAPTIVNLTHHSYFNLAGGGSGTILDHELQILAGMTTVTDEELIPTGELAPVADTPFDFRSPARIGAGIAELAATPTGGYDLNYALAKTPGEFALACWLGEPGSGRVLELLTTEPGLQLYSGNRLQGAKVTGAYPRYGGLCLEAQRYPDAVHHPHFPSVCLRPGQTYAQRTVYRFRVK